MKFGKLENWNGEESKRHSGETTHFHLAFINIIILFEPFQIALYEV